MDQMAWTERPRPGSKAADLRNIETSARFKAVGDAAIRGPGDRAGEAFATPPDPAQAGSFADLVERLRAVDANPVAAAPVEGLGR
jgi:hypothetical protein